MHNGAGHVLLDGAREAGKSTHYILKSFCERKIGEFSVGRWLMQESYGLMFVFVFIFVVFTLDLAPYMHHLINSPNTLMNYTLLGSPFYR